MLATRAFARRPAPTMARGLTTAALGPPDFALALRQHESYVSALEACGLRVTVLEALPEFPDAHFVEDVAVVTPELAVLARPGAVSRRGEVRFIAPSLDACRPTVSIEAPGTLDGGDVLLVGKHLFIGLSERTNAVGAQQLGEALTRFGYTWTLVHVEAGLHLKSSATAVGEATLLMTAALADLPAFASFERIVVDHAEAYATNTLLLNGRLIVPRGFPRTRRALDALGVEMLELDMSEFRKMDGALTCLSLRF